MNYFSSFIALFYLFFLSIFNMPPHHTKLLTFAHQNIVSLTHKSPEVESFSAAHECDIVVLTETHLNAVIDNSQINIPGFDIFRHDRIGKSCGGVAIYAKSDLRPRAVVTNSNLELLRVDISVAGRCIHVYGIYFPVFSNQAKADASEALEDLLLSMDPNHLRDAIFLGDFNMDLLELCDAHVHFSDMMHNLGLEQMVESPTRRNRTLLDHVWLGSNLVPGSVTIVADPISPKNDHDSQLVSLDLKVPRRQSLENITVWDYANADFDSLGANLVTELPIIISDSSIPLEIVCQQYMDRLVGLVSDFIPKKQINPNKKKRWVTPELITLLRKKQAAHARWKSTGFPDHYAKFRKLRKECFKATRKAKLAYMRKRFESVSCEAEFWRLDGKLRAKNSNMGDLQAADGSLLSTDQAKCDALADYYANCFNTDSYDGPNFGIPGTVRDFSVAEHSVYSFLTGIKSRGISHPEGIPNSVIKKFALEIAPTLTTLFNRCIRESIFPDCWKIANVIPVPKTKNPAQLKDWRPISLTSTFSKVFEKVILSLISPYFSPGQYQFGFTRNRSCNSCINSVMSRVVSYLENPKCSKVVSVFFDKRKAFDSVVHNMLLNKLFFDFHLHPGLVAIIRSFLTGRRQRVAVGSCFSTEHDVSSGVPQGSVLGPQLFLFFAQDLSELPLSELAELFLFADDSVLIKPIFRPGDYVLLQSDVNQVYQWCSSNSIAINKEKCRIMQHTYSNRPTDLPDVLLGDTALERVYEYRYLGVIVQCNPSVWTSHCKTVLRRARSVFYVFRNYYSKYAPNFIWLSIYRNAIRGILDYCCDVVLPNAYFSAQFERLQKLVLRSYLRCFDITYDYALLQCNMERLSSRRAASTVVGLVKYQMCAHFTVPNFCVLSSELNLRRRVRGDAGRDLVLVRNYPGDIHFIPFPTFSPSFKKSYFYRAVHNYNILRRIFDLDCYSFRDLRRVLSWFNYDLGGFIVV